MKFLLLPLFLLTGLFLTKVQAQDVLILKDGEKQIRCQIVSMTDSVIEYRAWKQADTTIERIRTQEMLSFQLDKKTSGEDIGITEADPEEGLMEVYRMGETVSGYVILVSGDTTEGFIQVKDIIANQFRVVFIDNNGKSFEHMPADLLGYGYGEVHYESVATGYEKMLHPSYVSSAGKLFLHHVVTGDADLYRIYRIEFNKSTISQNPFPPLYMGKLDHEFMIRNPEGKMIFSFSRGVRGTLGASFGEYKGFISQVESEKSIHKHDLPEWVRRFNGWYSEQPSR
jgi:hypothetical protein